MQPAKHCLNTAKFRCIQSTQVQSPFDVKNFLSSFDNICMRHIVPGHSIYQHFRLKWTEALSCIKLHDRSQLSLASYLNDIWWYWTLGLFFNDIKIQQCTMKVKQNIPNITSLIMHYFANSTQLYCFNCNSIISDFLIHNQCVLVTPFG